MQLIKAPAAIDDEDPLYDKVPSDEDYASVASESSSTIQVANNENPKSSSSSSTTTTTTTSKPLKPNAKNAKKQLTSPLTITTAASIITSPTTTKHYLYNSPSTSSSSSSNKSSNKNTPSPKLFASSKEHKILNTRFEKAPAVVSNSQNGSNSCSNGYGSNNSALVANAESCLNSIINSLNQIDYSHLGENSNNGNNGMSTITSLQLLQSQQNGGKRANVDEFGMERPNLYNELKNENELMQAMVSRINRCFMFEIFL